MRSTLHLSIFLVLVILSCKKDPVLETTPPDREDPDMENPMDSMIQVQMHPIGIERREGTSIFIDGRSGATFSPRGTNYFNIVSTTDGFQDRFFHPDQFQITTIRENLRKLKGQGYNTVRIFLDTCNDDPECLGNFSSAGLNQKYIKNIATLMAMAEDEDIFLILTSNDLPDQGGYWELSNQGASEMIEGYRNAHYLTSQGVESAVNYWTDLMRALHAEEAVFSHVLGWSILNEHWYFGNAPPFSLSTASITAANGRTYALSSVEEKRRMAEESIVYYIEKVAAVIKDFDPEGLVTMGVFAPNTPNLWRVNDFKYVETSEIVNNSALDFLDLHAYPATSTLANLMANFKVSDPNAKPIIMGEVGAFVADFSSVEAAGSALQKWIAESCTWGFNGWLTWGLERAPLAIGDATWSMFDQQEYLLQELSPLKFPDACNETWLGDENIAMGKKVTASNFLATEPPEFAVDGDVTTQWGSGGGPPQWFEVDLGVTGDLTRISLIVAQFPEGQTEHRILTAHTADDFSELTVLSGNTKDGDRLEWSGNSVSVRYVRIETVTSPSWVSWKEVEIYQ